MKSLRKERLSTWKRSEGSDSIFISIGLDDDTTFDIVSKKMLDAVLMFDVVLMFLLLEGLIFISIGHGDDTAFDNNRRQTGIIIISSSSARKFKQGLMIKRLLIMVELEAFWWLVP